LIYLIGALPTKDYLIEYRYVQVKSSQKEQTT